MSFAEDLTERYPESAKLFEQMAEEEKGHRHMLLEMYEQRFGQNLPPIRRDNVKGFLRRRPIWLTKNLSLDAIRKEAETMEFEADDSTSAPPSRPRMSASAGCSPISRKPRRVTSTSPPN